MIAERVHQELRQVVPPLDEVGVGLDRSLPQVAGPIDVTPACVQLAEAELGLEKLGRDLDRPLELLHYPRDIEEVIIQHPAVQGVALFGVPDEKWGESPVAAAVLAPGSGIEAEDLASWINQRVRAKHKRIREVVFYHEFPRIVAGKTLERKMRAECDAGWRGAWIPASLNGWRAGRSLRRPEATAPWPGRAPCLR